MNTTSAGSSTTQREESSRRVSRQMEQSSCSVRLKHRAQNPIVSLTSISAFAKGRASSGVNRKRWKVSLCAVLGPMPGSLANSSMSRCTGGLNMRGLEFGGGGCLALHAWEVEALGEVTHALVRQLTGVADGLVGGGQDHVFQHLYIFRIHCVRIDIDATYGHVPSDFHGHHSAPRRGLHGFLGQLLLSLFHVHLQFLGLLHHLFVVRFHLISLSVCLEWMIRSPEPGVRSGYSSSTGFASNSSWRARNSSWRFNRAESFSLSGCADVSSDSTRVLTCSFLPVISAKTSRRAAALSTPAA